MRILVVGGGGREHALVWALSRSPQRPEIFVAPGNPGTAALAQNVPIPVSDIEGLVRFAVENEVALTVVGPEQPLVEGLVDALEAAGKAAVGPSAAAARLEGSKAFSKDFMSRYAIPTAAYRTFSSAEYDEALRNVRAGRIPVVIKASGLAAGKGAVVCTSLEQAEAALSEMMVEGVFGEAGSEVVVEEFMEGEEVSVFALSDGDRYVLFPPAQDHKRVGEGDTGPNTGGMGAYAPAPALTGSLLQRVCREVIDPTIRGMAADGHPYRGILYVGLMLTPEGPKVVEYNCRFGDPEAQAVLPLVESDLAAVLQAAAERRLGDVALRVRSGYSACVVLTSAGYPGTYRSGYPIVGLEKAGGVSDAVVFQAGTALDANRQVLTAGGRVLAVAGMGERLKDALNRAYDAASHVSFEGVQFRRDIGWRGLKRLGEA